MKRARLLNSVALVAVVILTVGCHERRDPPSENGKFVGQVVTKWLDDGRRMQLQEDFGYLDVSEKLWIAPSGSVVDGASIPQPFWSIIGGPFEGKYRNASIIHDVGCDQKKEPWEDVHRVFFEASLSSGVETSKAKLMYAAVYHFGPRWEIETEYVTEIVILDSGEQETRQRGVMVPRVIESNPLPDQESVNQLIEYFERRDPSLEEIKTLDLSNFGVE